MPGILPDLGNGGVVIRDEFGVCTNPPGVQNAYCPNADFLSTCELTALPSNCEARITAAQINAIVSELISFAECLNPEGTWVCNIVQNLCVAWNAWKSGTGPGSLGESVAAAVAFEDCVGNPIPVGAAIATCIDLANAVGGIVVPSDRYITGLAGYDAGTNIITYTMSTGPNLSISMADVIADAVASMSVSTTTSFTGTGQSGSPLTLAQATAALLGGAFLATQAEVDAGVVIDKIVTPATLLASTTVLHTVAHDATLIGDGTIGSPLGVSGAVGAFSSILLNNLTDISPTNTGSGQISVVGNSYITYWAMDAVGLHIGTNTTSRSVSIDVDETSKLIVGQFAVNPATNNALTLGTTTLGWSALHMATGSVINFANGNYTLTHTAGLITASGGLTVNGVFKSRGIDDQATAERLELTDTVMTLGTANSPFTIQHQDNDMILEIGSKTGGGGVYGGIVQMYGGDHATRPGCVLIGGQLQVGTGCAVGYLWTPSTGLHTFFDGAGIPSTLAYVSGSNCYFSSATRFLQNGTNSPGNGNNNSGACIGAFAAFSSGGGTQLTVNNTTGTGGLVAFNLSGVNQGGITGTGTTITYGAFAGSHDSQFLNKVVLDILEGTLLETGGRLARWLGLKYVDHEGNEHVSEEVPEGVEVGDVIDFQYERTVDVIDEVEVKETMTDVEEKTEYVEEIKVVDGVAITSRKRRTRKVPVVDEMVVHNSKGDVVYIDVQEVKDGEPVFDVEEVLDKRGNPVLREATVRDNNGAMVFDDVAVEGEFDVVDGQEVQKIVRVPRRHMVPVLKYNPRMKKVPKIARVPRTSTIIKKDQKVEQKHVLQSVKATVIELKNDVLPIVKICETALSRKVYGGFHRWDHAFKGDLLTLSLGAWKVRLREGEKPEEGDWVVSSDTKGCGMVLDPDTPMTARLQACLVAKITDEHPVDIYEDGSMTFPCTYHCG